MHSTFSTATRRSATVLDLVEYCLEQVISFRIAVVEHEDVDEYSLLRRYDRKRVEEIGPDRACTEWLLRCGGSVRFKNWGSLTADYNAIPSGAPGQFQVEEIRAIKACITSEGFAYLSCLLIATVFPSMDVRLSVP